MELTYQGLKIKIPLEGLISVEEFKLEASFNKHVSVELSLIAEEEKIESAIHGLTDHDGIEVYESDRAELLFAGKITDAKMVRVRGLCCLSLKALSYTMDWDLVQVSQSFLNLDATYKQVMDKVLENQPDAEIKDCVTKGAVIPDFLLQYEESDWEFLARLASCFGTFLVPDCRSDHGRAYFGIPDLGEEYVLDGEDYQETKDMDKYYRIGCMLGILSQEHMGWEVTTGCHFSLGQKVRFKGISTIVTNIRYRTVDGELVRSYQLNREKGVVCPPRKNPHIFGMSIPATVKERSGNCVKVHFQIDPVYDTSPHVRYFTYAIESSFIYCMPEVGSQVHIYFPSDNEQDAIAVHAVRTEGTQASGGSAGYAQKPDYKSFSNVNGAELLLAPEFASMSADQENETTISLDMSGLVEIRGKNIEITTEKSLSLGEATEEDGTPAKQVALEASSLAFQVGESGTRIELTEEAKIIAAFVKMEATDTTPADNPTLEDLFSNVTANDEEARNKINGDAADLLVEKYEEGRKQILRGLGKIAAVVATVAAAVVLTVVTGGAALGPMMLATYALGAASIGIAVSDIGEGVDNINKAQSGNLDQGHNFLRDDVCGGNEFLYNVIKVGVDIAFGVVSGKAIGMAGRAPQLVGEVACGSKKLMRIKSVLQMGGNMVSAAYNQYVETGKISPGTLLFNMGLGLAQGYIGTGITDKIMGGMNFNDPTVKKLTQIVVGTFVDTGMDWAFSGLCGQPFDLGDSFARNAFSNTLAAFIADPVDAVTGTYLIYATDFLLSSLPSSWKLERSYYSTGRKDSVFGKGWSFPYASRVYRDTQDTEKIRVHMETITGHSVCFEKQGDVWVNQSKGTSRFILTVQEDAGCPEQEVFMLADVEEHTLCVYDRQGKLSYVEYPNHLKLLFSYNEEGLERITTPLGNVLEVECQGGRILQVTDEIGRRTQYRYAGEYLVDVVHTDEGITHYEYDENGHIISVTDQNGSRYIENEYDEKGRITRQGFTNGVYQTFTYDDIHRRNTIYYSETGKTEIYEYNDQLLKERTIYDDGTCETYEYSDDNRKTGETSRSGHKKEWEYDAFGHIIREQSPDGYEVRHAYDENDDLIRTWDTDGRETQYVYDNAHNRILVREKLSDVKWRETAKEYDALGRCIVERDALGNETLKEYDAGRAYPSRVTTPKGEETAYSYDTVGRKMSVSNSYGTVEMSYNSRNFVTSRTDGEGFTSHKFYDRMGNLTAYYPPVQWEKKEGGYEYRRDFLERVVDTISPLQEHRRVFRNFDGEIVNTIHPVSYADKGDDGEGTRYEYDMNGNCIRVYYPDGGTERRFYDADGNMIKQVQPESYDAVMDDGAGYHYAYDACGRLTQVCDPEGNVLHTYEYNGNGQITRETDGEGKETLYTYNNLGWKVREQIKVKDAPQSLYRVVAYSYDAQGNKIEEQYGQQEVEKDGEPESWHVIHFSYDKNNHLTLVKDDFGAQMRYDYDCLGNVTLEERVIEETVRSMVHYEYNKNGWRTQKTEEIQGNGPVQTAVTRYSYDANGNLIKIITPKGFVIHRSYDADDRLTEERVTDRKSGIDRRVQYAHDEAGNVLKRTVLGTDGECLETGFCYDLKDRLTRRTNPGGAVLRYFYDRNDKLSKAVSPYAYEPDSDNGAGTTYAYDNRGNRIRVANALGEIVQELSYNLQDQPVMQKDPFGNRTAYSYGLDGKMKEVRRFGDGKWNGSAGDSSERSVAMAQNAAASQSAGDDQRIVQQYEYNARGQIIGIVDGNRNPISYDVDSWGRITGVGFADGVKEGYEYTPTGQVSRTTDGNGNSVQYRYNSYGKVSERIDQLGYAETFQYDEEGNLSLHIDRDGRRLQRDCNVFGKPVYEKATDAEGNNPNIRTWHYDSLGRVTRAVCDGHSYEYVYDAQGNLKEKRSSGKRLVSYAYDKMGQITEIKDPAGVCTRYEYDILGRRSRIYNDEGLEVRYGYDALNRISRIHYGNGVETAYAYDGDGNISSLETKAGEKVLLSFAYRYDGNGNRTVKTGTQAGLGGITVGNNALDISYSYDIRGQLLEERRNGVSVSYAYDKAGNRVRKTDAKGATLYRFNGKNQLIETENSESKNQFTYDRQGGIVEEKNAAGIRLFSYNSRHQQTKVETEDGSVQENRYDVESLRFELLENGKRTGFVYHNGELLHEEGGIGQALSGQTSYHLGTGIDALQRGQDLSYYHRDEQLSTAFIISAEGEVQNSYQYDAFGAELESVEQLSNRIRYTGQQYDDLTGQYYLRARYYNPVLGWFMQEDVYQGDGLNLYAYCGNNPVVYYDPSGYKLEDADYSLIKTDTNGNGYAYYQNKDYNNALTNRGWSEYYEGSSFQAHHLLQGKWAKENLQNYGYDYGRAPTISLGTGYYTNDSGDRVAAPHTIANNGQTQREYTRGRGDFSTTLNSELVFGATDLLNAGMSEELVMSELERNYKMLDALNEQNRAEIEAGHLKPLEYDREEIEKVVHETAEQKKQQEEEMKSNNC